MPPGGNVQKLGAELDKTMAEVEAGLPVGITVHRIANQPEVVTKSFEEFGAALLEALAIVLVVSFISLGVRTGVIVALSVPLVHTPSLLASTKSWLPSAMPVKRPKSTLSSVSGLVSPSFTGSPPIESVMTGL